jgi:predicted nucleic acid-binding protein
MSTTKFEIIAPDPFVLLRAAELVSMYGNLPLGTTDAVVMAVAESRDEPRIATLDTRHFTIVRPSGFPHFELYPQQ